jgi:hypothetical protein
MQTRYFPLEMLVQQLEVISCKEGGSPAWVPGCLQVLQSGAHKYTNIPK